MRPLRLVKYHALSYWNWKEAYVGRFLNPLVYMVFLVVGFGGMLSGSPTEYLAFALYGLAVMITFNLGIGASSDVSNDRKWGVYANYRLAGGSPAGYLLSVMIFGVSWALIQLLALFGLFAAISHTVPPHSWELLLATVVGTVLWVGVGTIVGSAVNSYAKRDLIVSVITLPVVFSAPLFYQLSSAPKYLQWIAAFNPLTYQVGWVREPNLYGSLLILTLTAASTGLGVLSLRRADLLSRERL